ncbi:MAG: DrmB family protein [Polyangiaceae bacterium]
MANPKKTGKGGGGHRQPDGRVRLGQVITTFGPGAMVDLLEHAVLIGGLDYWRYDKHKDEGFVDEPRLRDAVARRVEPLGVDLAQGRAFRLAPAGDDDAPAPYCGIQVAEFPSWFVCQQCRALSPSKNLERDKQRYVHHCTNRSRGFCVPVRFVATCRRGHLEEFPWVRFVHGRLEGRCETPDLYLEEDASGDFSHIVVQCRACDSHRRLSEAREAALLPQCRGERPWLGPEGNEEKGCEEKLQLLVRTASSAYFAQWMSALSIPDKTREVMNKVSQADVWSVLQNAERDDIGFFKKKVPAVSAALGGYGDEEIFAALEAVRKGKTPVREGLRTAEYRVFMEAKDEVPGQLPPRDSTFFACLLPPKRHALPPKVSHVVLAKKLRQVRAQIGLTRLSATPPDLQGDYEKADGMQPLGLSQTWLPAAEIFGEGVLVCLDEEAVCAWEKRPEVMAREEQLFEGFEREYQDLRSRPAFPGRGSICCTRWLIS